MPTLFVSFEDILAMFSQLSTDELERLRDSAAKKYGDRLKAYREGPTTLFFSTYKEAKLITVGNALLLNRFNAMPSFWMGGESGFWRKSRFLSTSAQKMWKE